jgi:adenylosuccinate lyase
VLITSQVLSHEAGHQVKHLGLENDLIDRVRKDPYFDLIKDQLDELLNPSGFIGRAPEQVDSFLKDWVAPALADDEFKDAVAKGGKVELSV